MYFSKPAPILRFFLLADRGRWPFLPIANPNNDTKTQIKLKLINYNTRTNTNTLYSLLESLVKLSIVNNNKKL